MKPRRYQLRKDTAAIARHHPWIFRDQLSSAAQVFGDGEPLRLVDGANQVVGHGIYEAEGAIAIRVIRTGPDRPDAAWVRAQLGNAIAKRAELAATTDGVRLVHGESDGLPAIVVDRFGDALVVASYSAGADAMARYVARVIPSLGVAAPHVVLRPARRRHGAPQPSRTLLGAPLELARFSDGALAFTVDLAGGHKTGAYLDLRGLRRALITSSGAAPLANARVLNLFSYTGMLGRAVEAAGATEIVQVDASARALELAAAHHVADPSRHRFVTADVFEWLPALDTAEQFDLVIVDPPAMTSRKLQVPAVLAAYTRLYRAAQRHVRPGGALIAACCTSRIERAVFHRTVRAALDARFRHERDIPPEPDHPVGFAQADYLKIGWWRAT